jgi:beta-lactamase regulating signal transducer with metallopeptidase domain
VSQIQQSLFDLLLNGLLQIGFFAIVAALFSPLVARARAKHQYRFYVAVLLFCLATPVANSFWHWPSTIVGEKSHQQISSDAGVANRFLWIWQAHTRPHEQFIIPPGYQTWIIGVWGVLVVLRLAHLSRGVHRVHQVRREAFAFPSTRIGIPDAIIEAKYRVALLESVSIDAPVAVGVFHPAILLPSKVLPEIGEQELSAILWHEYSHIRRRDFLANILLELISLPVAWHPGIAYLMSKLSQARELACDDYAAARVGKRRSYANTLLHLASLCLHVPRASSAGLGIFDGDNLEVRIMMLTEKKLSLSRTSAIGLVLAVSLTFGAGAVLTHGMTVQASSESSKAAEMFAGTWHWMFDGRSFSTMILVRSGSGFTGSVTPSRITLNGDGGLRQADPSEHSKPTPITKATLEGSALHITAGDGFAFTVTLKDATHAEIHPAGAPPKMKPIPAEKVH